MSEKCDDQTMRFVAGFGWSRDPFFGGCHYHADDGVTVTGYYSPSDPLEFEGDCSSWTASNLPGQVFQTADAAMDAAESV